MTSTQKKPRQARKAHTLWIWNENVLGEKLCIGLCKHFCVKLTLEKKITRLKLNLNLKALVFNINQGRECIIYSNVLIM